MTNRPRPWYDEHFRSDYFRFWLGGDETPLIPEEATPREVAFIESALGLKPRASILDLCCGHGRHAIPLAERGYEVVGLDLSAYHLDVARRRAQEAQAAVEWLRADMRRIPRRYDGHFDAVIDMFLSFGYLESDVEDQRVLDGVARALKPGGRFLLDTINRDVALRDLHPDSSVELNGVTLQIKQRFDAKTGRTDEERIAVESDGTRHVARVSMRYYSRAELSAMLEAAGLRLLRAWGDFDGRELGAESPRAILLAEKPGP